jgi:hypothetical protein
MEKNAERNELGENVFTLCMHTAFLVRKHCNHERLKLSSFTGWNLTTRNGLDVKIYF